MKKLKKTQASEKTFHAKGIEELRNTVKVFRISKTIHRFNEK